MNLTDNLTSLNTTPLANGCVDQSLTTASVIGKVVALSIIMATSLIGNILIIYVVCKNHNLRRTINFFIVNIALSDLVTPIILIPRVIVETARMDNAWLLEGLFGRVACKFIVFLSDVSPTVSILSLIFMTVDRFLAVVFPLHVTLMNSRRRYLLIALTWIISGAFFSPYFYAMDVHTLPHGTPKCMLKWDSDEAVDRSIHTAYSTAVSIVFLIIPFFTITILYTIILMKTRKTPDLMRENTCASAKARQKQKRTAKRVTLMAFLIVLIFGLCWGPYNILLFLSIFVWKWRRPTFCGLSTFLSIVQFLCLSNAAINPCVYFVFIKNFRRGLANQLSKFNRRSKQPLKVKNQQSESLLRATAKSTNCSSADTCI